MFRMSSRNHSVRFIVAALALLCLAEAFHRSSYFDLPVVCAAGTCVGGLIFGRFLGRTHE